MIDSDRDPASMARVLEEAGWGVRPPDQYIADLDSSFIEAWRIARPHTLISVERAWAFAHAIRHVCARELPGDIVECGVWKGGACLLASYILAEIPGGEKRSIWLYDTFDGMPPPGPEDRIASSGESLSGRNPEGWWTAALDEVVENLKTSPLPKEQFRFVPGRVEESLRDEVPERIAVLRLDTDWYESTLSELEVLYPRLARGGVLLVDDYGHFTGARKAVDHFFRRRGEMPFLHRSDYTGRVIVKE